MRSVKNGINLTIRKTANSESAEKKTLTGQKESREFTECHFQLPNSCGKVSARTHGHRLNSENHRLHSSNFFFSKKNEVHYCLSCVPAPASLCVAVRGVLIKISRHHFEDLLSAMSICPRFPSTLNSQTSIFGPFIANSMLCPSTFKFSAWSRGGRASWLPIQYSISTCFFFSLWFAL